jgi:hypothetical protein
MWLHDVLLIQARKQARLKFYRKVWVIIIIIIITEFIKTNKTGNAGIT